MSAAGVILVFFVAAGLVVLVVLLYMWWQRRRDRQVAERELRLFKELEWGSKPPALGFNDYPPTYRWQDALQSYPAESFHTSASRYSDLGDVIVVARPPTRPITSILKPPRDRDEEPTTENNETNIKERSDIEEHSDPEKQVADPATEVTDDSNQVRFFARDSIYNYSVASSSGWSRSTMGSDMHDSVEKKCSVPLECIPELGSKELSGLSGLSGISAVSCSSDVGIHGEIEQPHSLRPAAKSAA